MFKTPDWMWWGLLFVGFPCVLVRGDVIWALGSGGKEVPIPDVRIADVRDGKIWFEDSSGRRGQRDLVSVSRLDMDDEPALAAAERAYGERKWAEAADGYEKALAGTRRDWVKAWIAPRLVESGQNGGKFTAAVTGYLQLVRTDVPRAEQYVLGVPEDDRKALDESAGDVTEALGQKSWNTRQRQCLLSLLLDIQRSRHDQPAVDALMDQMQKSGNAGAARTVVRKKLDEIGDLLERGQWNRAAKAIKESSGIFVEPRDQAEAMFCLARLEEGKVQEARPATQPSTADEQAKWQDAALAYMRVVAHFKDVSGEPFVAASLLKVGAIEERLDDEKSARRVYEQVAREFGDSPAGTAARRTLQRMSAGETSDAAGANPRK